jgi:hypothetical protein
MPPRIPQPACADSIACGRNPQDGRVLRWTWTAAANRPAMTLLYQQLAAGRRRQPVTADAVIAIRSFFARRTAVLSFGRYDWLMDPGTRCFLPDESPRPRPARRWFLLVSSILFLIQTWSEVWPPTIAWLSRPISSDWIFPS